MSNKEPSQIPLRLAQATWSSVNTDQQH